MTAPRGLRWRLTLSGATILIGAFAITSVAVYRGTGSVLRGQIDRQLRADADAFVRAAGPDGEHDPRSLAAAAAAFIRTQPFRATSRLLFETIPGAATVTNEPEFLGLRPEAGESAAFQAAENAETKRLLATAAGLSTVRLHDIGPLRLLVRQVSAPGRPTFSVGVGQPLAPVDAAQDGVARTLALAGGLTLVTALIATFLIASRHSLPLRRMARTAAQIDAGDLSPRIDLEATKDEARVLALALNHMLDRLADAFGRQRAFVSDASHELRTPLTVIGGQLEVLVQDADPPAEEVRRVEQLVRTEVERMTRLVDDLLILARSEEPQFIHRREIDLPAYAGDLLATFTPTAERRLQPGRLAAGRLHADPDRLAQALRNVLRNAIDHTPPDGVVRLSAGAVDARPGWIRFAVDDDGPGIPADQLDQVFDRFHRTDLARSRPDGGSGIGLAIVRAIVLAHGGAVRATPSPLGGARIEIELPGFTSRSPSEVPPGRGSAVSPEL
ncbi:MAG: two-component system, OmpR family, sensor kinase [Solirubrobacteraceae bacterium]|jgi:signal transduction histidine kinase|nr:two-component system, OmpR family, sensor kinase [Solirubrobacteraceae bacterium]